MSEFFVMYYYILYSNNIPQARKDLKKNAVSLQFFYCLLDSLAELPDEFKKYDLGLRYPGFMGIAYSKFNYYEAELKTNLSAFIKIEKVYIDEKNVQPWFDARLAVRTTVTPKKTYTSVKPKIVLSEHDRFAMIERMTNLEPLFELIDQWKQDVAKHITKAAEFIYEVATKKIYGKLPQLDRLHEEIMRNPSNREARHEIIRSCDMYLTWLKMQHEDVAKKTTEILLMAYDAFIFKHPDAIEFMANEKPTLYTTKTKIRYEIEYLEKTLNIQIDFYDYRSLLQYYGFGCIIQKPPTPKQTLVYAPSAKKPRIV